MKEDNWKGSFNSGISTHRTIILGNWVGIPMTDDQSIPKISDHELNPIKKSVAGKTADIQILISPFLKKMVYLILIGTIIASYWFLKRH